MVNENITTQIKIKMVKDGIKQQKLSEKSGVDRTRLSQILNGHNWTRDTMNKILNALELTELITLLR